MTPLSRRQLLQGAGIAGLGLLAECAPLPLQQPPPTAVKVHRLGFLNGADPLQAAPILDMFLPALAEVGYVEGRNLTIEYRWGEGSPARLAEPAAELAHLPVDVFVVVSTEDAQTAREATTTVPIVLAGTGDPVVGGLAGSYARPGGNVTGVMSLSAALSGKRLQILKETVPRITRVAVFWAAENGPFPADAWGRDAEVVGVQLHPMVLRGPEEFDDAFEAAAREGADALVLGPGALGITHRAWIVQRAARLGWPAVYPARPFVTEGGLMVYQAGVADTWRRAAVQVDKILRGANPAEIPIEQPMRFELTINLKTAQALGLTIPEGVLLQATEVTQ